MHDIINLHGILQIMQMGGTEGGGRKREREGECARESDERVNWFCIKRRTLLVKYPTTQHPTMIRWT